MKISVIVPVYKVENELERCLCSVCNQTYENIEIILVDDGSPDRCPQMCDRWANDDDRITVIHKENGGLSDARNSGLKIATGDYVLFVDSDDSIAINTCENLVEYMRSGADIIVGNAVEIANGKCKYYKHSNLVDGKIYTSKEFLVRSIKAMEWYAPSWICAYKRKYLIDNDLFFISNLLHEDLEFMSRVYLRTDKICYCAMTFYNYYIRDNSINQTGKAETNGRDLIYIYNLWMERFKQIDDKDLRRSLYGKLVKHFLYTCRMYQITENSNELVKGLTHGFIIRNSINIRERIKGILYCFDERKYCQLFKNSAN